MWRCYDFSSSHVISCQHGRCWHVLVLWHVFCFYAGLQERVLLALLPGVQTQDLEHVLQRAHYVGQTVDLCCTRLGECYMLLGMCCKGLGMRIFVLGTHCTGLGTFHIRLGMCCIWLGMKGSNVK